MSKLNNLLDFRQVSIEELHRAVAKGELTFSDIAENCIQHSEKNQKTYHPWVRFNAEQLHENAAALQTRFEKERILRPLEGIPLAVKDNFNTADFATEMGSPLWKDFTPGNDARVVYNAKQAGAVIPGKTVTAEFAVHSLMDETINPHDPKCTPGTSSSGSAVAIALGLVPVALGSQTAGSIIRPASFCGVYGYKPSFGTLPRTGTLKTTDSLDSLGFFTTRFSDCERVFDTLRVHGRNYPFIHRTLDNPDRQKKPEGEPWRVAFIRTHTWDHAPEYARKNLETWIADLKKLNIEVSEVELPASFDATHSIHATIYNFSLAYYFQEEASRSELVSPVMYELIEAGRAIDAATYHHALRTQEALCREMNDIMSGYDALISLSTAGSAPLRGVKEKPDPSLIWTLTHLPSISAPAFVCPESRPFGIQIAGQRLHDYRMLEFVQLLVAHGKLPAGPSPLLNL